MSFCHSVKCCQPWQQLTGWMRIWWIGALQAWFGHTERSIASSITSSMSSSSASSISGSSLPPASLTSALIACYAAGPSESTSSEAMHRPINKKCTRTTQAHKPSIQSWEEQCFLSSPLPTHGSWQTKGLRVCRIEAETEGGRIWGSPLWFGSLGGRVAGAVSTLHSFW